MLFSPRAKFRIQPTQARVGTQAGKPQFHTPHADQDACEVVLRHGVEKPSLSASKLGFSGGGGLYIR